MTKTFLEKILDLSIGTKISSKLNMDNDNDIWYTGRIIYKPFRLPNERVSVVIRRDDNHSPWGIIISKWNSNSFRLLNLEWDYMENYNVSENFS